MRKTTAPEAPRARRSQPPQQAEPNALPLAAEASERLLDKAQVHDRTHLGTVKRNTLERADEDLLKKLGLAAPFPRRRWIGRRCYWLLSEVTAWMQSLPSGYSEPIVDPEVTRAAQKRRHAEARKGRT